MIVTIINHFLKHLGNWHFIFKNEKTFSGGDEFKKNKTMQLLRLFLSCPSH